MDELTRRYAALVRLYPPSFRREHGAALLSTALDAAPAGATRPPLRDTIDLVRGAMRAYARPVRTRAALATWRRGAGLAADAGVTMHAVLGIGFGVRFGLRPNGVRLHAVSPWPVRLAALAAAACAVAALVALLAGRRRPAAWLDIAAVGAAALSRVVLAGPETLPQSYQRLGLGAGLAGIPAIVLFLTRHSDHRPARRALAVVAAGAALAAAGRVGVFGPPPTSEVAALVMAAGAVLAAAAAIVVAPWRPHVVVAVAIALSPAFVAAAGAYADVVLERVSAYRTMDATFAHWPLASTLLAAVVTTLAAAPVVALFAEEPDGLSVG